MKIAVVRETRPAERRVALVPEQVAKLIELGYEVAVEPAAGERALFSDEQDVAWSKVFEQSMGTEAFAQMMGKQMEAFLNAGGPMKKAVDQQIEAGLAGLGLPSRTQVVALAHALPNLRQHRVLRVGNHVDGGGHERHCARALDVRTRVRKQLGDRFERRLAGPIQLQVTHQH